MNEKNKKKKEEMKEKKWEKGGKGGKEGKSLLSVENLSTKREAALLTASECLAITPVFQFFVSFFLFVSINWVEPKSSSNRPNLSFFWRSKGSASTTHLLASYKR